VPAKLGLLENWIVAEKYFETTAKSRNQFDFGIGEAISDLVRQTGGARLVVSNHAIFDTDLLHWLSRSLLVGRGVLLHQLKGFRSAYLL
jgi:hypothetical protein